MSAEVAAVDLSGQELSVTEFQLGKTLGTGSFGRVRFVTHKSSANTYALKILKKSAIIRLKQVDHVISEKAIMQVIKHPFIVNLCGTFHDNRYLYLLLQYIVGGEFFTHLRKAGRFEDTTAKFYTAQIASIFEYLHSKDVIYRDLKPENILLGADGYAALTDFGFAKVVEFRTYTLCGTPEYLAPEVLLNRGHGRAVDWWTLGILTYEEVVGYPPFVGEDPMSIYQKILSGKIVFPRFFEKNCKVLVKKLLTADLARRWGNLKDGAADVVKCKWFASVNFQHLYDKEIQAPYKPFVKNQTDTSNFEDYPDSEDLPPVVSASADPFVDW